MEAIERSQQLNSVTEPSERKLKVQEIQPIGLMIIFM